MIRRIIQLSILMVGLLSTSGVWATTYYIDWVNGSDTNNGTSKSTPWKRAPGMRGCWEGDTGGNCNVKRAGGGLPGDQFILKGGVTWPKEALAWTWYFGSGTQANPIYFGVDQTWYTGASWSRPILDAQGTEVNVGPYGYHNMMTIAANWVIIDNIEFTGAAQLHGDTTGSYGFGLLAMGTSSSSEGEIKNCYFHGWSHGPVTNGYWDSGVDQGVMAGDGSIIMGTIQLGANPDFDCKIHHNVIDGSDTTGDMAIAYRGSCGHFYNNYIGYLSNNIITVGLGYVWGNTFDHIARSALSINCNGYFSFNCVPPYNQHGNGIETYNVQYPIYNNLFKTMGGGANLILYPTENWIAHIFNNVIVDDGNQTMQLGAESFSAGNTGGYYIFNNTIQAINTNGTINGGILRGGSKWSFNKVQNNHIISSPIANSINMSTATTTLTQDHNLDQTAAVATAAGYVTSTYPYFPPAGVATIGAGVNLQSIAARIPSTTISDAATAALSDTTCGVKYDATNHRVIGPNKTPVVRGTKWDVGAYQFRGSQIAPPSNLKITP